MIHAYLFITKNNRGICNHFSISNTIIYILSVDRDGHGPEFVKLMNHINEAGGYNITIYHSFKDEVDHFRTHWWECNKCKHVLKRAMNRKPGPYDYWFHGHQKRCGGDYIKIREPAPQPNKKRKQREEKTGLKTNKRIKMEEKGQNLAIEDDMPKLSEKNTTLVQNDPHGKPNHLSCSNNNLSEEDIPHLEADELIIQSILLEELYNASRARPGSSDHDPIILDD